jgi:outer membrane receptor protein involved in Fe transport
MDRTEGFREHSERVSARVGGQMEIASGSPGALRISAAADLRDFDEPGALGESAVESDPSSSSIYHRFDNTHDQGLRGDLMWDRTLGASGTLSATLFGEKRETEATRTLVLAPVFADTKERVVDSSRTGLSAQFSVGTESMGIEGRLLLGVDVSSSNLDSRYYGVAMGGEEAYEDAGGVRGALDASGEGERDAKAVFAHYLVSPTDRLRLSFGVRGDWIDDTFQPDGASEVRQNHSAVSPRVGLNIGYLQREAQTGNLYVSIGRSFKAPTLDQLFDQRSIPVNFPPFSITTSNAELSPQRGNSIEAGLYHNAILGDGRVGASFSLSAYRMDMVDELDFDVEEFRYKNIGESRHDGIEFGLRLHEARRGSTAFVNYTLQNATNRTPGSNENFGNYLKAIPRHSLSVGVSTVPAGLLEVGVVASRQGGIFLDDANSEELPAYTRVDLRLAYPIAGVSLHLGVRNLLDSEYSTTGFPDPSGFGGMYYRPAAGRTLEVGLKGAR